MPIFATSPGWTVVAGKRTEGLGRPVYAGRVSEGRHGRCLPFAFSTLPHSLPVMPHTRPKSTCIDRRSSHATRGARCTVYRRCHSLLQLQTHVGQNAIYTNRPSLMARSKGSETVRPKWHPISACRPRSCRDRSANPSKVELGCKSQIGERTGQSLPNYA